MDEQPEGAAWFATRFLAAAATAAVLCFTASVTTGPVNYLAWFGFLLAAMVAVVLAAGGVLRAIYTALGH